jgi:hypothetical protein
MINKIYKRIHSKYSRLFNFFFFLRYVFVIFLIAIVSFLSVPKLFDYEKKKIIITKYLIDHYDLELINYNSIEYKIFPFPNLFIKNLNFKINNKPINLKSNSINIFLNIKNIYNYKNFSVKKILFNQNEIVININEANNLINYFKQLKYKLDFKNLHLYLKTDNKPLLNIKNINFSNYGYKKYKINGEIFDKKFLVLLKNENQIVNFQLLDTGINAKFKLDNKNLFAGSSKINLSNNLLKFDFNLKNNQLKISKSNFRNKKLSFSLDSLIKFNPFFNINSILNINEIDKDLMNKVNLKKILKNREIIKKLNGKINIKYKSKKYFTKLIDDYHSNLSLANGRIIFSNKFLILKNEINCKGDSVLTDEYPRLNFICSINLRDKKKLLKKFSLKKNSNKDHLSINIQGSLNLFNKKINFKTINTDRNYLANKEDLKYFKETFESILFDKSFFQIFNEDKIEKFLLEII